MLGVPIAEHQIEQREAERQKAYEEFLSQKEEVDKVVQQMRAVRLAAFLSLSLSYLFTLHCIALCA